RRRQRCHLLPNLSVTYETDDDEDAQNTRHGNVSARGDRHDSDADESDKHPVGDSVSASQRIKNSMTGRTCQFLKAQEASGRPATKRCATSRADCVDLWQSHRIPPPS